MSKLETNTIDNISGSSTLTIGDSNASTISIPKNITLGASGTTITVPAGATITNNGTQTGFGGTNTPYFYGELSTSQNVSNGSSTKAQLNNIILDSVSGWDGTNYRYTPGVAGKYFISGSIQSRTPSGNEVAWNLAKIYISGTEYEVAGLRTASTQSNYVHDSNANVTVIRTLSASDYVELYGITYGGGTTQFGNELTSLKVFKVSS